MILVPRGSIAGFRMIKSLFGGMLTGLKLPSSTADPGLFRWIEMAEATSGKGITGMVGEIGKECSAWGKGLAVIGAVGKALAGALAEGQATG